MAELNNSSASISSSSSDTSGHKRLVSSSCDISFNNFDSIAASFLFVSTEIVPVNHILSTFQVSWIVYRADKMC